MAPINIKSKRHVGCGYEPRSSGSRNQLLTLEKCRTFSIHEYVGFAGINYKQQKYFRNSTNVTKTAAAAVRNSTEKDEEGKKI